MIGELRPYAEYKDSGLPWLRAVPAHWSVVRNGSLFGQRSQTGYSELPILEVSLKTGVQVRSFGTAKRKQIMSDLGKYKRAVKGDLAHSTASDFVITATPALLIADGTVNGPPFSTQVTMIEITDFIGCGLVQPPAARTCSIQRRPTAFVTSKIQWKTMFAIASKARGDSISVGLMKFPAALLTSQVGGPSAKIDSTIASTACASRMSTPKVSTRQPCAFVISPAAASSTALRRPQITRSARSDR